MPTTSNFGWTTPADTDLVKDGAAAIRTLGNGIDTSFLDLKGGTTGQILSKASNTDLDYTWINNDQGDITGVTAGTGLSGGGTSGAVTLAIDSTVTTLTGTQTLTNKTIALGSNTVSGTTAEFNTALTDGDFATIAGTETLTNKTLTSPVLTTPSISNIDAKGDLLVGTADNTIGRLGVGTSGHVLTADSGETTGLKWAAPTSGGYTLISSQTMASVSSVTFSSIPGTYQELVLILRGYYASSGTPLMQWEINSDTTTTNYIGVMDVNRTGTSENQERWNTKSIVGSGMTYTNSSTSYNFLRMRIPDYTNTVARKFAFTEGMQLTDYSATNRVFVYGINSWSDTSAITAIKILNSSANNWTDGTALLYGVK